MDRPFHLVLSSIVLAVGVLVFAPSSRAEASPNAPNAAEGTPPNDPPASQNPSVTPGGDAYVIRPEDRELPYRVSSPPYGLGLQEVTIQTRPHETIRLTARQWRQIVDDDVELSRLRQTGRALVPGIVFTVVGGLWLGSSMSFAIDGYTTHGAAEAFFVWVVPVTFFTGGVLMTAFGGHARWKLNNVRMNLQVTPSANRHSAQLHITGRF